MACLTLIHVILAIVTRNDWDINTFNFNNAFLNGQLGKDEEVYMEQPPGYEVENCCKFVLKLKKSIYSLKQSRQKWYETLCSELTMLGFRKSEADPTVFYQQSRLLMTLIAVYIDDCIIAGGNVSEIAKATHKLNKRFKLTDMGVICWLLGIEVMRDRATCTLSLSQQSYIETILACGNFTDLSPWPRPWTALPSSPTPNAQLPLKMLQTCRSFSTDAYWGC